MKPVNFAGRLALVVILFVTGFAVRQVVETQTLQNAASTHLAADDTARPAVRGVLYDGGFPSYSAVVQGDAIDVRQAPDDQAPITNTFADKNDAGAPTTFLVTGQQQGDAETGWYQVLLPVRPNESKGWVRASDVRIEGMRYRVEIHRKTFKLQVFKDQTLEATYSLGLGTDKTPTPDGLYSIVEVLRPPDLDTSYGTHVLGLNGYSEVETDWPDGGRLAIHGTNAPATTIGRKVSHGCVRLRNSDIDKLAGELPLGTPVRILA